jgi:hypothetical protein
MTVRKSLSLILAAALENNTKGTITQNNSRQSARNKGRYQTNGEQHPLNLLEPLQWSFAELFAPISFYYIHNVVWFYWLNAWHRHQGARISCAGIVE